MHQHSKSIIFLLISAIFLGFSSPIFAQGSGEGTGAVGNGANGVPEPPKTKIPPMVAEAIEAFNEKRYLDAARLFEKGYEAAPLARVLKNAMVSWYFAGNCLEAARVAARYVVLEEPNESVEKVVDCALDEIGTGIKKGKLKEMQHLLNVVTSSAPTDEQKKRIDKYWKALSAQESEQERIAKREEVVVVSQEDTALAPEPSEPVSFYSLAPWIGSGLLVVGAATAGTGSWMLNKQEPNIVVGQTLAGAGSIAIFGAAAFLIYWLTADAPKPDQNSEAIRLYENPAYAQNGGMSRIELAPRVSTREVSASIQVVF